MPLGSGSIKSNIGHLEGGSGMAGVIKVILSLEKGIIPPLSDHYHALNPRIDVEHLNMQVVSNAVPWPPGLRRASVNSFGFGGANSHAILEDAYHSLAEAGLEANHNTIADGQGVDGLAVNGHTNAKPSQPNGTPAQPVNELTNGESTGVAAHTPSDPGQARVFTWSAADKDGLTRMSEEWEKYFAGVHTKSDEIAAYLDNLAYTLNERRSHMLWRCSATADPDTGFHDIVSRWSVPVRSAAEPTLAYVFTGVGSAFIHL